MTGSAPEWHIITGEFPPTVGGVSDYAFTVATALAAEGPVHVWCPATPGSPRQIPGVVVHSELASFSVRELIHLGRQLDSRGDALRLFVQWVPQGFGCRSLNVGFAGWLAWRALVKRDQLHLMVHEPYIRWSIRPARLVASFIHRTMLALAGLGASRVWLSTPSWESLVRPYIPRRTPIGWLPVPAPLLTTQPGPAEPMAAEVGGPRSLTVGHFSMHSPLITSILATAIGLILEESDAKVLLIGRDSDTFRASFVRERPTAVDRVLATGALPPESIGRHLRACDVMMQPYPDGVTARRTSTLTLLALGLPIVTNSGELSEAFWSECQPVVLVDKPDGRQVGRATLRLLDDRAARTRLSKRATETYDSHFASRHAVAMLAAATTAQPDAA